MAYIGAQPSFGNFQACDAISVVNGQAAYTLQVGGTNISPQSAQHCLVSLNGILQAPISSYTISGSTLTFAANLATGDSIDFITILGDVLDLGVPSDSTVTSAKLVYPLTTFSSTGIDDNADATAMTITSAEKIGIGETVPLGQLHVKTSDTSATASSDADELVVECGGGGAGGISLLSSTNGFGNINFGDSGDNDIGMIQYDHDNNSFTIKTNASEQMRITSDGKLRLLHGNFGATPSSSNKGFEFRANGSQGGTLDCGITDTSNHTIINFDNGNGGVGTIQMNGSATAYNTSSDYRLKENVNYDFDATSRLKQLKPARFNFKADADTTVDGFLAHEVSSIVPEAISGEKDAVKIWKDGEELPEGVSVGDNILDADGNTIMDIQGIDQSKLVPLLVKTIQELEARITALES